MSDTMNTAQGALPIDDELAAGFSPDALNIKYSSTQVRPDALLRLQRTHGVVKADRSELTEAFKMLRNQVLQRMRADGFTLLAVTSPTPKHLRDAFWQPRESLGSLGGSSAASWSCLEESGKPR